LHFAPDSQTVAVAHSKDVIRLLRVSDGCALADFEAPNQQRINHLAFSPDGRQLAVACGGPILLWDLGLVRQQLASMNLDWDTEQRRASLQRP
jgi:WD40 repeat protein